MPRVLVQTLNVPDSAIDVNGHVNNLAYLQWMQDSAIAHSSAQGWPLERYQQGRAGWVVRSHYIEYLRPAFARERLLLLTWVTGLSKRSSPRKFLFWRPEDQQAVARAETLWVFVDSATRRPCAIPPELASAFEVVSSEEEALATLPPAERPTARQSNERGPL
jgi:acyl-CoA thioester hydrolase